MLNKSLRLKKTIFGKSALLTSPYFNLKTQPNKEGVSRFGFVVSKKIDKRATVRNRIKRLLRSCIEENTEKIREGHDLLFVLKKEAIGKERSELCSSLLTVLSQERLLK